MFPKKRNVISEWPLEGGLSLEMVYLAVLPDVQLTMTHRVDLNLPQTTSVTCQSRHVTHRQRLRKPLKT